MSKKYVVLYKHIGETPLSCIRAWQARSGNTQKAAFAGRLDPMAEGALLVLLGDECKRKDAYTELDKEYEVEVLFDISTDTGDVLGLSSSEDKQTIVSGKDIFTALSACIGSHEVAYPLFSSKTVNGTPLFLHALRDTIQAHDTPTHIETIYRIQLIDSTTIATDQLRTRVTELLSKTPRTTEASKELGKDFRIDAVRTSWQALFEKSGERGFAILQIRVACASGTYMRTLASRIAHELGTTGIALSIKRTKIGTYYRLPWGYGYMRSIAHI